MTRLSFITQFKIEFLIPFTGCRKMLRKMSAIYMDRQIDRYTDIDRQIHRLIDRQIYVYIDVQMYVDIHIIYIYIYIIYV